MQVVIPKTLEVFVRRKVEEGRYTTAAGRVIELETEGEIDALFARL